jgi:CHAT domain-containing protein
VAEPFELADEVVSLPMGLLRCGVPGVVGTLWPVADASTALVMVRFYELLRDRSPEGWPPLAPAAALAAAQRWLRDARPAELQSFLAAHPALLGVLEAERGTGPVHLGALLRRDLGAAAAPPYLGHPYHWAPFVYYGV